MAAKLDERAASLSKTISNLVPKQVLDWISSSVKEEDDDEDTTGKWGFLRKQLRRFLLSPVMELFDLAMICVYMAFVVMQTDAAANDEREEEAWLLPSMFIMNLVHVVLVGLRFWSCEKDFFKHKVNVCDVCSVIFDLGLNIFALFGISGARPLSFVRLLRFVQVAVACQGLYGKDELNLMIRGLASALKSTFWGLAFACVLILGWSILATQVLHPIAQELSIAGKLYGYDRGGSQFSSVFRSFLTFTQVYIAGDSWGQVAIAIIEAYPATGLLFGGSLVSIQWCILNMILAAVVDASGQARHGDERDQAERKRQLAKTWHQQLLILCRELDTDGDGRLSMQEVCEGSKTNRSFMDTLAMMDVGEEDLQVVFHILDSDQSGDVDYEEFADQLYSMRDKNLCTMLCFIKHYVVEVKKKVFHEEEVVKQMHQDMLTNQGNMLANQGNMLTNQGTLLTNHKDDLCSPRTPNGRPNIEDLEDTATHDAHGVTYCSEIGRPLQQMGCELQKLLLEELTATVRREIQDVRSKCDDSLAMLKDIRQTLSSAVSSTTSVAVSATTSLELRRLSNDETDARKLAQTSNPPKTSLEGCLESDPLCTSLARRAACCAMKNASPVAVKPPESYLSESAV